MIPWCPLCRPPRSCYRHDRSSYPDDRVHFYYSSSSYGRPLRSWPKWLTFILVSLVERGVISDAFQADSVF